MAKRSVVKRTAAGRTPRVAPLRHGENREVEVFRRRRTEVSPADLQAALVRPVEALLRTVCHWGDALGDGWDLGDYRFLILDFRTGGDLLLYVQFWSEPKIPVLIEVSSGLPNPPARQLVGAVQRKKLRALGYRIGGSSKNYQKELEVGRHHLRALAEEAVHILTEVFGYTGITSLRGQLHADTRAEAAYIHSSITPGELAKVLSHHNFDVSEDIGSPRHPRMTLTVGDVEVDLRLEDRVPGQNLFRRVVVTRGTGEEKAQLPGIALSLEGGVTTEYLSGQLVGMIGYVIQVGRAEAEPGRLVLPRGKASVH